MNRSVQWEAVHVRVQRREKSKEPIRIQIWKYIFRRLSINPLIQIWLSVQKDRLPKSRKKYLPSLRTRRKRNLQQQTVSIYSRGRMESQLFWFGNIHVLATLLFLKVIFPDFARFLASQQRMTSQHFPDFATPNSGPNRKLPSHLSRSNLFLVSQLS